MRAQIFHYSGILALMCLKSIAMMNHEVLLWKSRGTPHIASSSALCCEMMRGHLVSSFIYACEASGMSENEDSNQILEVNQAQTIKDSNPPPSCCWFDTTWYAIFSLWVFSCMDAVTVRIRCGMPTRGLYRMRFHTGILQYHLFQFEGKTFWSELLIKTFHFNVINGLNALRMWIRYQDPRNTCVICHLNEKFQG